jgi:hypothetical protein
MDDTRCDEFRAIVESVAALDNRDVTMMELLMIVARAKRALQHDN